MGLFDELVADESAPLCGVGKFRGAMTPEDQADLDKALSELDPDGKHRFAGAAIARHLEKRGARGLKPRSVQRHRNRECGCP